ncbi:MAG TPA: hypothetical protein VF331_23500 [Polyangiales bacterium]
MSADDATDTGYFAVRAALARTLSEAAKYLAPQGLLDDGAPVVVRLIGKLAARFALLAPLRRPIDTGKSLGGGAILGELPSSFVKRRLGIAPGKTARGQLRARS